MDVVLESLVVLAREPTTFWRKHGTSVVIVLRFSENVVAEKSYKMLEVSEEGLTSCQ